VLPGLLDGKHLASASDNQTVQVWDMLQFESFPGKQEPTDGFSDRFGGIKSA
jgi:hypothetical protein